MLGRRRRRVLLRDLEDPVVGIISYVKNPAVPKARFFAFKSADAPDGGAVRPPESLRDRLAGLPTEADAGAVRRAVSGR